MYFNLQWSDVIAIVIDIITNVFVFLTSASYHLQQHNVCGVHREAVERGNHNQVDFTNTVIYTIK